MTISAFAGRSSHSCIHRGVFRPASHRSPGFPPATRPRRARPAGTQSHTAWRGRAVAWLTPDPGFQVPRGPRLIPRSQAGQWPRPGAVRLAGSTSTPQRARYRPPSRRPAANASSVTLCAMSVLLSTSSIVSSGAAESSAPPGVRRVRRLVCLAVRANSARIAVSPLSLGVVLLPGPVGALCRHPSGLALAVSLGRRDAHRVLFPVAWNAARPGQGGMQVGRRLLACPAVHGRTQHDGTGVDRNRTNPLEWLERPTQRTLSQEVS